MYDASLFCHDVATFGVLQGPFHHNYWLWLVQFSRNLVRITIFLDRRACKLLCNSMHVDLEYIYMLVICMIVHTCIQYGIELMHILHAGYVVDVCACICSGERNKVHTSIVSFPDC